MIAEKAVCRHHLVLIKALHWISGEKVREGSAERSWQTGLDRRRSSRSRNAWRKRRVGVGLSRFTWYLTIHHLELLVQSHRLLLALRSISRNAEQSPRSPLQKRTPPVAFFDLTHWSRDPS